MLSDILMQPIDGYAVTRTVALGRRRAAALLSASSSLGPSARS
jgi:hypothetical protein